MATSASPTTTSIPWAIQTISLANGSFPVGRLVFRLFGRALLPENKHVSSDCWVDTGAPLSVIPFHVHDQRLDWQKIPSISTTWNGQKCDLGRLEIWLPTAQPPFLRGPLELLAKFAQSDPAGPPVPMLLGLEFFLTHQAEFDLRIPPMQNIIRLP